MNRHNRKGLAVTAAAMLAAGLCACNEKDRSEVYQNPESLAVLSFKLKSDTTGVRLQDTYFAIDLNRGVIFNPDSLPVGTDVTGLVADIKFAGSPTAATVSMEGGRLRSGDIDYKKNPGDSIDFTGRVTLRVEAEDGDISTEYLLKVNVHREVADSMFWSAVEGTGLSSRLPDPVAQRTVTDPAQPDMHAVLVEESDGSYTRIDLNTSGDKPEQTAAQVVLPFTPAVHTLTEAGGLCYLAADDGSLWHAAYDDWGNWEKSAGETPWAGVVGTYGDRLIGLTLSGGKWHFIEAGTGIGAEVPEGFPVRGATGFVTVDNRWSELPTGFLAGGVRADGSLSAATWAYDGARWAKLSEGGIPALEGAVLVPYYNYRPSASGESMIEYNVWMVLGGLLADGTANRTVYISYDNGVHWQAGAGALQLPEEIPALAGWDALLVDTPMRADIADGWAKGPMRLPHNLDGTVLTWQCPYIWLIGGRTPAGTLNTRIWRGVLNRLTFTPII